MKRAGSPVRPRPTVVEDAVGEVGALLHLGDQDAAPDGVDRARGDEKTVSLSHLHPVKHVGQASVPDAALQLLPCELPLEPHVEESTGLVVQDEPHLRLARAVLDSGGVGVVRVDLDGEGEPGVDELHQQGKGIVRPVAAGDDLRVCPNGLRERAPRPGAVRDDAVPGGVGGQLPALRDRFEVGPHSPIFLQTPPTPEVILAGGGQRKGFHAAASFSSCRGPRVSGTVRVHACHPTSGRRESIPPPRKAVRGLNVGTPMSSRPPLLRP